MKLNYEPLHKVKEKWVEYFEKCHAKRPSLGTLYIMGSIIVCMAVVLFCMDILLLGMDIFNFLMLSIFHSISRIGGFESLYYEWAEAGFGNNSSEDSHQFFDLTWSFLMEVTLVILGFFKWIPAFIYRFFSMQFPVLEMIHLDLSWLLVDFSRIARTFFNLIQFALLFVLARKDKRKIRRSFESGTDWEQIKCF